MEIKCLAYLRRAQRRGISHLGVGYFERLRRVQPMIGMATTKGTIDPEVEVTETDE